jgi:DNA-binding GntR family transcriptional regulator
LGGDLNTMIGYLDRGGEGITYMSEISEQTPWIEEELVTIRDKVYNYLKNAILNGEYKSGERLIERELADKLKISRTPIREALFRLESQGFVKTVPRKGVVVSKISSDEVLEVFTILSSLSVLAVKLAIQRLDNDTEDSLKQITGQVEHYLDGSKNIDVPNLHMEINETLFNATKSPKLTEIIQGLYEYIRAFANMGYEVPGRMRKSMEEHRDVLVAVRNKESEMAEYLTRIHIENSRKAYMEVLEKSLLQK